MTTDFTPPDLRGFHGRPKSEDLGTREDPSGRVWFKLLEPLVLICRVRGRLLRVEVPTGFESDLGSVPRRIQLPRWFINALPFWLRWIGYPGIPLWSLFPPSGRWNPAVWTHDFCYSKEGIVRDLEMGKDFEPDRPLSDVIFLKAMILLAVEKWRRVFAFLAVRWFAGGAYHSR